MVSHPPHMEEDVFCRVHGAWPLHGMPLSLPWYIRTQPITMSQDSKHATAWHHTGKKLFPADFLAFVILFWNPKQLRKLYNRNICCELHFRSQVSCQPIQSCLFLYRGVWEYKNWCASILPVCYPVLMKHLCFQPCTMGYVARLVTISCKTNKQTKKSFLQIEEKRGAFTWVKADQPCVGAEICIHRSLNILCTLWQHMHFLAQVIAEEFNICTSSLEHLSYRCVRLTMSHQKCTKYQPDIDFF